jgi:hypothetical protein
VTPQARRRRVAGRRAGLPARAFVPSTASATVARTITDPALDVPATAALFGPFVYAVNARFSTPPTPDTTYDVIQLKG